MHLRFDIESQVLVAKEYLSLKDKNEHEILVSLVNKNGMHHQFSKNKAHIFNKFSKLLVGYASCLGKFKII